MNTEKEKFLSAYKKKIEEMSIESERALLQSRAEKIEMQSMMDEFNSRAQELLEEKHVWLSEKENLENNVAELQTKVESFASERGLLGQKNRELSCEVVSLKSQLNEHNAKLAHLKDEMEQNASVLDKYRT